MAENMKPIHRLLIILGVISLFYLWKLWFYGTILPHSYLAKNILLYYQSQPIDILFIWKHFALAAPVIALIGAVMDKRVRWLIGYIILAAVACLLGPRADWVRYTVHLFPLMLIAGAPVFRGKYDRAEHHSAR